MVNDEENNTGFARVLMSHYLLHFIVDVAFQVTRTRFRVTVSHAHDPTDQI